MIEAAMLWNEPNNKSHWDFEIDRDWTRFAQMTNVQGMREAVVAVLEGRPTLDKLITHSFRFSQVESALAAQCARPEGFVKALVRCV